MDIRCPKCAEPWDPDTLHEEVERRFPGSGGLPQEEYSPKYDEVRKDFYSRGCPALLDAQCNPETLGSDRARVSSALMGLLGDDVDGLAAMEEEFDLFG